MRTITGSPDFRGNNSISPESLPATKPLTKEPEDSGYEIEIGIECFRSGDQSGDHERNGTQASFGKQTRTLTRAWRERLTVGQEGFPHSHR